MYISILVFGDSIAWGAWDPERGGWADQLKAHFQDKKYRDRFRIYTYNLSIAGETTDYLLEKFQNKTEERVTENLKRRKYDVIIFAVGTNDSRSKAPKVSLEKFQKNLIELIKQAKEFTPKIVFVGLNKIDKTGNFPTTWKEIGDYDNESITKYDSVIRRACLENEAYFIPMSDSLKHTDLEDGLHPNSQGHQRIFERVRDFLIKNKLIER